MEALPGREGSLSLVIVDVDHFKVVNDSFGHTTGDDVLRRIARLMAAAFPREATVGRYGGEEFIAMLPGVSERDAAAYAEGFRATVEAQSWREGRNRVAHGSKTTPSAG